ncbi:hypothetical protein WA158_000843 [Blastocystis sp. Blastoise]
MSKHILMSTIHECIQKLACYDEKTKLYTCPICSMKHLRNFTRYIDHLSKEYNNSSVLRTAEGVGERKAGGGVNNKLYYAFFSIFILFIMDSPKQFAPDYKEGNWKPYGNFEVDELSDSDSEMDTIQTESEDDYEDYIKNFIDF